MMMTSRPPTSKICHQHRLYYDLVTNNVCDRFKFSSAFIISVLSPTSKGHQHLRISTHSHQTNTFDLTRVNFRKEQMNDVPRWQAKFISEFYYETYHYLYPDVPHFSQLNNEQSFMLAALIYGDLLERWPILKDAQNYVRNGNKAGISGTKRF